MTQTATAPSADAIVCSNPACSAQNRAGTRFCAACGTSLAGPSGSAAPGTPSTPVPPIPQAPTIPPPRPNFAGAAGAVPTDRTLDLAMAPHQVYAHLTDVLATMSATVTSPAHPTGLLAVIPYKSLGTPLRFNLQAIIQPAGPGSRMSYGVKVDWSSTFVMLGILAALGLVNVLFLGMWVGPLAPLCSIGAIGWAVYDYAVGIPNRLAAQIQKKVNAAPASPVMAAPVSAAPVPAAYAPAPAAMPVAVAPAPAPAPTPAPAPVPAASDEGDIIAKIEKLAALKDKGLLSDAEYEQRRTDLLNRL